MGYVAWSVVFGEQPSASKWNILGQNDASFNDGTGIANLSHSVTAVSNPYKFLVYRNAAANTGSGAFAKIDYDTEVFDTNNNFATGTYTAPVAGFYQFSARTSFSSAVGILALYVNGAIYIRGSHLAYSAATMGVTLASPPIQLAANDTVEVYVQGNSAAAMNVGVEYNYFGGYLISRT